jgi:hypothetical protein
MIIAITGTYNFAGLTINNAYIQIDNFNFETATEVQAHYGVYVDAASAAVGNAVTRGIFLFTYDLVSADNIFTQGYNAMLASDEFSDYSPVSPL